MSIELYCRIQLLRILKNIPCKGAVLLESVTTVIMKIWSGVIAVLGFLLCCTDPIACNSFSDVHSDSLVSLNNTLKKFAGPRNHQTSSDAKEKARGIIKKSFQDFGLHVWSEKVILSKTLVGENIVGLLSTKKTDTADDKIVIVGAHYDTMPNTTGVDDNGSGVTALLETAKQIGKAHCKFNNTIVFVAFDFEEYYKECNDIRCGSKQFVKNLTKHLQGTKGTVNGAFVLETILNHNTSKDSQYLPPALESNLKEVFDEVKNDFFRGNFIAVIGRRQPDKELLTLFKKYYKNDQDYRAQLIELPIPAGKPPQVVALQDFYRSDHYEFWANDVSYSAVSLTDTADFRGYMKTCYHKKCDNLRPVKDDDLEFLRRTIDALIQSVLDLSKADSCVSIGAASMSGTLNLALLLAAFTSSAFIAVN